MKRAAAVCEDNVDPMIRFTYISKSMHDTMDELIEILKTNVIKNGKCTATSKRTMSRVVRYFRPKMTYLIIYFSLISAVEENIIATVQMGKIDESKVDDLHVKITKIVDLLTIALGPDLGRTETVLNSIEIIGTTDALIETETCKGLG